MSILAEDTSVSGGFDPGVGAGTVVGSHTFPGLAGEGLTLVASCAGYAPRLLTVRVSLNGAVVASAQARVSFTLPVDGTYTVEVVA